MISDKVRKKVLAKIKPTNKQRLAYEKIVESFIERLEMQADEQNMKVKFFVGGSFGKETYIKTNFDVDLFCKFDPMYDDKIISTQLGKLLEGLGIDYEKEKGSRDYYSLVLKKIKFELVPVLNVKNPKKALNTTDISPYHVEYMKKKINKNPNLADEIRLSKLFFKAKKLYGAESYIAGFSGHVIDILMVKYKSLERLIKEAKKWSSQEIIDVENYYDSKQNILKRMDKAKLSALVVVDPIIKERNAARALSKKNYDKFCELVAGLEEITVNDFKVEKFDRERIIDRARKKAEKEFKHLVMYEVSIVKEYESQDIIGAKLKKLYERLGKRFKDHDFSIKESRFEIDIGQKIAIFYYLIDQARLSNKKKLIGPRLEIKKACEEYKKVHPDCFEEADRLVCYEKRSVTNIQQICKVDKEQCEKLISRKLRSVEEIKLL